MKNLLDHDLIVQRRRRALKQQAGNGKDGAKRGGDFLTPIIAGELAERLMLVERHFDTAIEFHPPGSGIADSLMATAKIGELTAIAGHGELLGKRKGVVNTSLDAVPVDPGSTNLIVAPLCLHLSNDTPGTLIQIRRALAPDGLFLAAVPGAGTLNELNQSLLLAEQETTGGATPRIVPFADVKTHGALLQRAGFTLPVADVETLNIRYARMHDLMRDLRAMGMTNPLSNRSRKPVSRRFFERVEEIYHNRFADADGRIRATFVLVYLSGWAPHESQQKPLKPGSAKTRLADALRTVAKDTKSSV